MRRVRSLLVLAGVALAAVVAALALRTETGDSAIPGEGALVFPDLLARVDEVRRIRALSGGETFTLVHDGEWWTMPERDGYRAVADKVHKLVVGAAGLERREPKTSDPARYPRLGLDDPAESGAGSIRFTIEDDAAQVLADFIIGNRESSRIDLSLSEFYLREPGDARSWLVEGKLSVSRDPVEWLEREVLRIDEARVRAVRVRQAGGGRLEVSRSRPDDDDFSLDNAPPGHVIESRWRVNDIGRGLADLRFQDVRRAPDEADPGAGFSAELLTFDGLGVEVRTRREDDASWLRLRASFDEASVDARFGPAGDSGGDPDGGDADREADGDASEARDFEPIEGLVSAAAVREEVERLNEAWEGWEFQLPDYKRSYFTVPLADLVKPAETNE